MTVLIFTTASPATTLAALTALVLARLIGQHR